MQTYFPASDGDFLPSHVSAPPAPLRRVLELSEDDDADDIPMNVTILPWERQAEVRLVVFVQPSLLTYF